MKPSIPPLYLDIETIPSQRADVMARIARDHVDDDSQKAFAKADSEHRKTALSPLFGEVVSFAVADNEGAPRCLSRTRGGSLTEEDLLRELASIVGEHMAQAEREISPIIVGHNVVDFDRHFVARRMIVCGLSPSSVWTMPVKPWDRRIWVDTMHLWGGKFTRLNDLAMALSIPGKTGSGADVYDLWLAGRDEEIRAYNVRDVEITRAVFLRTEVLW